MQVTEASIRGGQRGGGSSMRIHALALCSLPIAGACLTAQAPARPTAQESLGRQAASRASDLVFRVLDSEDHPIAGAVAVPDLLGLDKSDPTDAQGWSVLKERKGGQDLSILAPHFKLTTVRVVHGQTTPTVVHLEKANALELILHRDDGSPSRNAVVQFRTEGSRIFPGDTGGVAGLWRQRYFVTGTTCGGGNSETDGQPVQFCLAVRPEEDGRIVLEDVNPDQMITIDVADEITTRLVPSSTVKIGGDERAKVMRTIDGPLQDVIIRVKDEHGAGLPGARVRVTSMVRPRGFLGAAGIGPRKTDQTGACRFSEIRSAHASITAEKKGYRAWCQSNVAIGPGEPSVECVLTRSDGD